MRHSEQSTRLSPRDLQARLAEAARRGDVHEVKRLLRQGAKANCRVLYGAELSPS
ncbi:MAG: hypothetical protein NZ520_07090 [bacterium]|nr:hypothetical protein [bacterium]